MPRKIEHDVGRFRRIVRGEIKKNLRKYMSRGDMITRKGKDSFSIPVTDIDIPRFRYQLKDSGGVAQGPGDVGDPVAGDPEEGEGQGEAGNMPGQHVLEAEFTLEELARLLGEELGLPRIEPKGQRQILAPKAKYSAIRRVGPESLRHFKRTFREALKRQVIMGRYNPKKPRVIPIRDDFRYRSWKEDYIPETNAVIFYIMDVSGSMGEEQKTIVRIESFWIDTWLRYHYPGLEVRYIIHDTEAREVDRETFFRTKESGGTKISSSYELAARIIRSEYPVEDWNIYVFQFSDGDNWSMGDNERCQDLLRDEILPRVNLFGYGQVHSPYGSGKFIQVLEPMTEGTENLVLSEIEDREAIMDSIKTLLGRGK